MMRQVVTHVQPGGARTAQPLRVVVHLDPAEDCGPGDASNLGTVPRRAGEAASVGLLLGKSVA